MSGVAVPMAKNAEPSLWMICLVYVFQWKLHVVFNLLTPNVNYSGRTAPLTSKVAFYIFIQQI